MKYRDKESVPQWVREYLENVSGSSFDDLELSDINEFIEEMEDND